MEFEVPQIATEEKGEHVDIRELDLGENDPIPSRDELSQAMNESETRVLGPNGVDRFPVGFVEDQNRRHRRTMEDGHSIVPSHFLSDRDGFFAVYDGHGGKDAMKIAVDQFGPILKKQLMTASTIRDAISETFRLADEAILDQNVMYAGCTVAMALILERPQSEEGPLLDSPNPILESNASPSVSEGEGRRRFLFSGNAGDARVVLVRGNDAIRLTHDHKGDDADEVQRVYNAGGFVFSRRVSGILAVTRALGDHCMKQWVIGTPYIEERELGDEDSYVIVACDGLFDVLEDQDVADLVLGMQGQDPQKIAAELKRKALEDGTTDNLSIMVVQLKELEAKKPPTEPFQADEDSE